jgi:polar amino acid transport system substrate-binding protein
MFTLKHRLFAGLAAASLAAVAIGGPSAAAGLEVIEAGKLNVAFNGDMPGTSYENGRLIGLDGELMHRLRSSRSKPVAST